MDSLCYYRTIIMKVFHILLSVSLLSIPLHSPAQITIDAGDMPSIGEGLVDHSTIGDQALNVGPIGQNQTWTIPDYEWETSSPSILLASEGSSYESYFPTATHCMTEDTTADEWFIQYWRLDATGLFMVGFVSYEEGEDPLIAVFNHELTFMQFPLTFGTAWATTANFSVEVQPEVFVVHRDSVINIVDGWGTLNTPFGSWPSLRLREHRYTQLLIPGQPPQNSETYKYHWFTEDDFAGATMEAAEGHVGPDFSFGHVSVSLPVTEEIGSVRGPVADNFSIGQNYPNPFNPTTNLPIALDKAAKLEVTVYNELGEVVSSEIRTFGPGNHIVGFDGSQWASGSYFAQIRNGDRLQTKRMLLVK